MRTRPSRFFTLAAALAVLLPSTSRAGTWMETWSPFDLGCRQPILAGLPGGDTAVMGGNGFPFVVRLDPAGGVIWQKHVGLVSDSTGVVASDDGGLFISARPSFLNHPSWVARFDAAGQLLWTRTSNDLYIAELQREGDGIVLLTGPLLPAGDGTSIVRLDGAGATLWNRTLPGTYPVALAVAATGDIFVAAASTATSVPLVARLTPDGDLLWAQQPPAGFDLGGSLARDASGGVYTTFATVTTSGVAHLAPTGTVTWARAFPPGHPIWSVSPALGGGVLAGTDLHTAPAIHALDSAGRLLSSHGLVVAPVAFEAEARITMAEDGAALVAFEVQDPANPHNELLTVRADPDGFVDATCTPATTTCLSPVATLELVPVTLTAVPSPVLLLTVPPDEAPSSIDRTVSCVGSARPRPPHSGHPPSSASSCN